MYPAVWLVIPILVTPVNIEVPFDLKVFTVARPPIFAAPPVFSDPADFSQTDPPRIDVLLTARVFAVHRPPANPAPARFRVFADGIQVFPRSWTAPVPVVKVLEPAMTVLPFSVLVPVLVSNAPVELAQEKEPPPVAAPKLYPAPIKADLPMVPDDDIAAPAVIIPTTFRAPPT